MGYAFGVLSLQPWVAATSTVRRGTGGPQCLPIAARAPRTCLSFHSSSCGLMPGPPQVGFLDLTAPPHPAGGPLDPGTQEPSKPPPGLVEAGGLLPCAQSSLMTRVLSVSFLRVYVPVSDFPGSSIPSSRPPSRPRSCFIELHIRTRYGKAHSPG